MVHPGEGIRPSGVRPEGRPRYSVSRWLRCQARPSIAARASVMRKREVEVATTQMGRMGAEDPVGIFGRTPEDKRAPFVLQWGLGKGYDDLQHPAGNPR